MEEVPKESGHRASVSMPSLDATDDFAADPSPGATTDSPSITTDTIFGSVTPTETLISSSDALASATASFSSVETGSGEGTPTVEDTQLVEAAGLIEEDSDEIPQGEVLDESQAEEDPSIAIDQFIKKIADEQLSAKRTTSQENVINEPTETGVTNVQQDITEESNIDSVENISVGIQDVPVQENPSVLVEENTPSEETSFLENAQLKAISAEPNISLQGASVENLISNHSQTEEPQLTDSEKTESMDIDSDIQEAPTQKLTGGNSGIIESLSSEIIDSEDLMQAESIEEIQKEINKIPIKKMVNNEESQKIIRKKEQPNEKPDESLNKNKDENHTQESITKMLEGSFHNKKDEEGKETTKNEDKENSLLNLFQDSSEVSRDPNLIEKAQEEIKKVDVLVCGGCHNTFHFLEEFKEHKNGSCPLKSTLVGMCENESKPQVWGFILWKVKQIKDLGDRAPSSWAVYQKWCKLPQDDKNAWITAGQSIQFASKLGTARVTEVKVKPTKPVLVQKVIENEVAPIEFVDSNKENSKGMDLENSASNILKKGISKPVKLNNDVTILPSTKSATSNNENSNKAIRTTKVLSTQKQEYVVEKIVAKRFNPRKKTWEYQIKWENFGNDANTWEPISNLSHCKEMLDQFEEQLKRVKEEKAKQSASPKSRGRPSNRAYKPNSSGQYVPIAPAPPKISNVVGGVSDDYGGVSSRPQRSSKQKALNQVKAWCGNISDDDGSGGGTKRKYEDDDSDEDYDEKKIKMEEYSDDSDKEEVKPKISIKKVTSTPKQQTITVKNGGTGAQQILPSNILIPDANGVVRINQKQLPSLSSGVYIMSKTAGIIKLDSSTSKVATSGGQTIVKVAPKIGQTQIKIVKKDGNTTKQIIQVSPKTSVSSSPYKVTPVKSFMTQKSTPKIRKEVRNPPPLIETSPQVVKKVEPPKAPANEADDSDDGLEPLPFPSADEPIPEIDSPTDEFVLDPVTGKIAGQEYVDKPVVIKEEPQIVPPSTNDLENIVKLAAAEITEDDLHQNDQMETDPLATEPQDTKPTIRTVTKSEPNSGGLVGVRRVVKYTAGQGVRNDGSILNKALTQGGQRAIISPLKPATSVQQRPRVVQQRVINQMVTQRTPSGQTRTVVRQIVSPQSHQSNNLNVIRTKTMAPRPKFNIAPQRSLPSPIQPTRTYSAMGGVRQQIRGSNVNKVQVFSNKSGAASQAGGYPRKIGSTVVRNSTSGQITPQKLATSQQKPPARIIQTVVRSSPKRVENQTVLNSGVSRPAHQMITKVMTPVKPKTVINMPSLTDEESSLSMSPKVVQKPPVAQPAPPKVAAVKQEPPQPPEVAAPADELAVETGDAGTDWSSFTMADGDNPIYVTGDDGTIYQVAGQNEQGQTILITQGADGQQQCLLVTNEITETQTEEAAGATAETSEPESVLGIPEGTSSSVAQESETAASAEPPTLVVPDIVQAPLHVKTDITELEEAEEAGQDQVVAQVVRAEPPSPGGTHKVVVMLPDGNLMVTQVSPEEYASLELD